MNVTVLVPARLASTRLPNKPLADLAGVPMVVRVAQRVGAGMPPGTRVIVAGDSTEILDACQRHGVQAVLTRQDHPSGSDRLAEACELLKLPDDDLVVNVQGDEPLMDPALVGSVAQLLAARPEASMSTAAHPIHSLSDFLNPNVVKVVLDNHGLALYFSRAPIPLWRDQARSTGTPSDKPALQLQALPDPPPLRHIGIYAYRVGFLREFPVLPQAPLEQIEALEQLRAMWYGHRIAVHVTHQAPGPGVDTPEDLVRVRQILREQASETEKLT